MCVSFHVDAFHPSVITMLSKTYSILLIGIVANRTFTLQHRERMWTTVEDVIITIWSHNSHRLWGLSILITAYSEGLRDLSTHS